MLVSYMTATSGILKCRKWACWIGAVVFGISSTPSTKRADLLFCFRRNITIFHHYINCKSVIVILAKQNVNCYIITRQRSWSFAEYWKYFVARLNDVQAFGYNSARSERIWMKFGALRVYCLELALADFGCDPRRSYSGSANRFLFFFVR